MFLCLHTASYLVCWWGLKPTAVSLSGTFTSNRDGHFGACFQDCGIITSERHELQEKNLPYSFACWRSPEASVGLEAASTPDVAYLPASAKIPCLLFPLTL